MAATRQLQTAAALSPAETELKLMWQDAELEFSQLTRRSLRTDREKRLEDVLEELDRKYRPPDEATKEAGAKAKVKIRATIGQVLSCIQLLGGLAAQGASIVFGPATLCFNAISFLIDVPGKIASVYEGVGNLFEEISHFLVLFKIYEKYTTLDPDLRDGTHKLMMSMVRICGLSIKIIEGGVFHQIKIGAKVTFLNDDSGVSGELTKFKALIDKQSHITEAITLQHILTSEGKIVEVLNAQYENAEKLNNLESNMSIVVADVGERKMQMILSERVDQIAKMLSVPKESGQEARKAMQSNRDSLLAGSAQWLLDHDDYKEWKTSNADSIPLLLLSGDAKTGKSFLLAAIEEDLRKNNADVAIAYYEFTGRDAKSSRGKHKVDVVSALKSMALQLAGQSKPYAKEMAALKDEFKAPDMGKEKDLWEKLWWDTLRFLKYSQTKEQANFVLLFDGIEELSDNNRGKFLRLLKTVRDEARAPAEAVQQQMRIIVTAGQNVFENPPFAPIKIHEHNIPDIKLYIEEELRKDEVLQGQHVEMLDLLQAIRTMLPDVAMGSFSIAQQKLERIREAVDSDAYLDEVETILRENPADDWGKLAGKVINDLNATLNAHEIIQLNELLHWCVFGFQYFTFDELRATIFLNSGRASLQPFERKLKNKYARVLHIEDDRVGVDPDIENLFRSQESSTSGIASVSDLDNARITMTISINQADPRTVQQFFWDLTERVGIGKFDFFHKSTSDGKGVVRTDNVRAHYHITEQLLKLLNDEPHEKTKCLVPYALRQLIWHLKEVYESLNQGKLGAPERRSIAKSLVDLLSDVEGIEKFWSAENELSWHWLEPNEVPTVRDWLMDEKTIEVLQPKERRWVRLHTADSEGKGGIYKPITLMVARRWLRDHTWRAFEAFTWINKYIELQNSKEDQNDDNVEGTAEADAEGNADDKIESAASAEAESSPEDQILAVATWVQQALFLAEGNLDFLWYERLAETFHQGSQYAAARRYYEKAKELPGCRWTANEGWALAVDELSRAEENEVKKKELRVLACDEMEIVLTHLRSSQSSDPKNGDQEALVRNLKRLASWHEELKSIDRAFALYEEAVEVDPQEHATRCELLKALFAQNKGAEAREMLVQMFNQRSKSTDRDLFSALLRHLTEAEGFSFAIEPLNIILFLGQADASFNSQILEAFPAVIADVRKSNLTISEGVLLLHQGIVLARDTSDDSRIQQAIRCWEDCQSLSLSNRFDLSQTRALAARFVAQHYFNQVTKQSIMPEEREQHFNQLLRLNRLSTGWIHGFRPTSYLASYYVQQNQAGEARKLFAEDMAVALDILSDNDPDNDTYGYKLIANICMHCGDNLNALSAWSLLGPSDVFTTSDPGATLDKRLENGHPVKNGTPEDADVKPVENGMSEHEHEHDKLVENGSAESTDKPKSSTDRDGPLGYSCDGFCSYSWYYANEMYVCRYCPDTQFTRDCWEKLKADKLERYICNPSHSWLHVPPWSDKEALEVGQGKVRVHGELVDDRRVGGDIVDIEQWLDEIRGIWGVPKKEVPVLSEPHSAAAV